MEPMATDEAVVAAFERDGVVCIRQVLGPAEVVAAADVIDAVLARPETGAWRGRAGGGAAN
jgi:hypothetical protein